MAGALWAWARDRPVLTGVLIGLGTATKLYPLFLLGGLLVICLRQRRLRRLRRAAAGAAHRGLGPRQRCRPTSPDRTSGSVFWHSTPIGAPTSARSGSIVQQA